MKRSLTILLIFICFTIPANSAWALSTNSGSVTFNFGSLSVVSYDAPSMLGWLYYYGDAWGSFGSIPTPSSAPYTGSLSLNASNYLNSTWSPTTMSWNEALASPGPSGPNPNQGLIYAGGPMYNSKLYLSAGNDLNLTVTYSFNGTTDSLYDGTGIVINILEVGYGSTAIAVDLMLDNTSGRPYEVDTGSSDGSDMAFTNRSINLPLFSKTDLNNNWWVSYSIWPEIHEYAPIGGQTPVPEPATMLLLGLGLMGLAGVRRKIQYYT